MSTGTYDRVLEKLRYPPFKNVQSFQEKEKEKQMLRLRSWSKAGFLPKKHWFHIWQSPGRELKTGATGYQSNTATKALFVGEFICLLLLVKLEGGFPF